MAKFEFKLYTLSPVHIGGGQSATAKEYIYEDEKYYFPDMGKFYVYLMNNRPELLTKYENFLLNSGNKTNKANARLTNFVKENNISKRDFGGFYVGANEFDDGKPELLNDISLFVRDGYGKKYIPGSSLKGAIRTIIENMIIKDKYNSKKLELGEKYDNLFHDIRVYDSNPISDKSFIMAGKYDYKKQPKKIGVVQRESIKPWCVVKFEIDTRGKEATELIEQLVKISKEYYKKYQSFFLLDGSFDKKYIQNNFKTASSDLGVLYLGAGSGIWTKTIMDKAWNNVDKIRSRQPRNTKMKGKGVMKLTKAPGKTSLLNNNEHLFEMGKCNFEVIRVD